MDLRSLLAGIGAGFTAFAITAVLVIEIVEVDPGAGILGVGLGALVGIAVLGIVSVRLDDAGDQLRWATEAIAGFGWTALFLLFLSYGDIAGLRSVLSPTSTVVVAAVVAVMIFLGNWIRSERLGST